MSVLAESCSADGPDGLHGVGGQELLGLVVGGVWGVWGRPEGGPGRDVYAHPRHIRSEPDGRQGLGRLWEEVGFRTYLPVGSGC